MGKKQNIVIVMTDQQRADMCSREGYPLDLTPFLDKMAKGGSWFNRAYTSAPLCAPARSSLLTGRFPSAVRVRTNHNIEDALFAQDLVGILKERGYTTALCGKNHSYLAPDRVDHWFELDHTGGSTENRSKQEKAFDCYLESLHHRAAMQPTPFPIECQCAYRAVTDAQRWIGTVKGKPFFLWLSFPEPHNPYQVPDPYFSLFQEDSLPPPRVGAKALTEKGFKWQFTHELGLQGF